MSLERSNQQDIPPIRHTTYVDKVPETSSLSHYIFKGGDPVCLSCNAWWTFRIFFIFFCSGRGKGESEAPGGGGSVSLENPRRGGSPGGGGAEGPGGCLQRIGEWGGGEFFFSGPKCLPRIGSAIWEALSRPISLPSAGRSSQPPHSKPLKGRNRAIVVLYSN